MSTADLKKYGTIAAVAIIAVSLFKTYAPTSIKQYLPL